MYKDFLTFIENNVCYGQEVPKLDISEETFIMAFANTIKHIRNYLKGKEELAISKNLLILLKSRYVYLPDIYKIIGKYYPKEVAKRAEYNKFCTKRWESLLEAAQNGQSNYEKGVSLEDVADYYISCIEGLKVTERRVRTENEEIDLKEKRDRRGSGVPCGRGSRKKENCSQNRCEEDYGKENRCRKTSR